MQLLLKKKKVHSLNYIFSSMEATVSSIEKTIYIRFEFQTFLRSKLGTDLKLHFSVCQVLSTRIIKLLGLRCMQYFDVRISGK